MQYARKASSVELCEFLQNSYPIDVYTRPGIILVNCSSAIFTLFYTVRILPSLECDKYKYVQLYKQMFVI